MNIKNLKYLLLISLLAVLILPNFVSAMTAEELTAKIRDLEQQLEELKAQLAQLQVETPEWCHDFNKSLKIENSGEEVAALHIALGKEGFSVFNEEKSNKEFGESTASAVSGFQQKYLDEVLTPWGLKYGTGFVGPTTRAKLNKLYGCTAKEAAPSPVSVPVVSEQVKCLFKGSQTEQKCYASDVNYSNYNCSGIENCLVDIKGNKGDKITWQSSCVSGATAGSYAYTIMDGQNESIEFICPPTVSPAPTTKITSSVTQFVTVGDYVYAVTTEGSVLCWNKRSEPEKVGSTPLRVLSRGTDIALATVTASPLSSCAVLQGLSNVARIALGSQHNCIVKTDGSALCWGSNDYGQLGDGTTNDKTAPTQVSGLTKGTTADIVVGGAFTCALKTDGSVVCWGINYSHQLGDGTNELVRFTPTQVSGLGKGTTAAIIPTDGGGTCALKTDGSVVCWGSAYLIGYVNEFIAPEKISYLTPGTIKHLAVGRKYACALKTDDSVVCWGRNIEGQIGDGTLIGKSTPTQVSGLTKGTTAAIAVGMYYHACALKKDGSVVCWGDNSSGQIGDGTIIRRHTPTPVLGLGAGTTIAITAGSNYSACALKTDNSIVCWGGEKRTPTPVTGTGGASSNISPFKVMASILESARQTLEQILQFLKNR